MPLFKVQPPIARGARAITIGGDGKRTRALLGRLGEFGPQREVWLDLAGEHVVAIVGKRGSGKTHTLGVLVENLASQLASPTVEGGAVRHAIVVFDTLNLFQWVDLPLAEASGTNAERQRKALVGWKLDAATLNPTFWHPIGSEPASEKSQPFSINPSDMDGQDWGRLLGVDIAADPMGQLLSEIHSRVARRGAAKKVGQTKPSYGIEDMIHVLRTDPDIQADYAPETIRAVRQRLSSLAQSPLFDAAQPDWTTALRPGHVAVFLLGRVPEDLRSVLVFLVIRRLLENRSAASEAGKHAVLTGAAANRDLIPPCWLVIDEAQNILPSRNSTAANDILTRFVREGRNFGLSLAVTTQQPSSLDARVMAQVDTLIAHNLTVRNDINYILGNLKSAEADSITVGVRSIGLADAIRQLDAGQCMISAIDSPRLLFCSIRPRLTLHGGFEA